MPHIVLASKNPVKAQATENGFKKMFPEQDFQIMLTSVPSGVSDQPMSNEETYQGALNRVDNARIAFPESDFWIGIEGGVEPSEHGWEAFAWIVVKSKEMNGKGRTGSFFLPPKIVQLMEEGLELGDADDIVFGQHNSKQENGAVGLLTGNIIDRAKLYEHAVVLALIPFKNNGLYATAGNLKS
jgi:inosine/xanthosine triphosphatase